MIATAERAYLDLPLITQQAAFADRLREIMAKTVAAIMSLGEPPIEWPAPGFDFKDTIATLCDMTPPPNTSDVWRRWERRVREEMAV